jgi:hypothetical protein
MAKVKQNNLNEEFNIYLGFYNQQKGNLTEEGKRKFSKIPSRLTVPAISEASE